MASDDMLTKLNERIPKDRIASIKHHLTNLKQINESGKNCTTVQQMRERITELQKMETWRTRKPQL
jgi:hypothetical protein